METFSDWLTSEIASRNMSAADLARASGKSQAVIGRILNNERKPAPETLIAIARALHMPVEEVFRVAGVLPPAKEKSSLNPRQVELLELAEGAEERELDMAIAMLRAALKSRNTSIPQK